MEKIENIMKEEKINNRSELLRTLLSEGLKAHESRKHRGKGKEVEKHGDC
jgi:metal-responsive CopG/Arc/MetJ family transcriptional regulator